MTIPPHVYRGIADIRRELNKKNIQASDRRYRQSLALLQAHAYLEGGKEVHEKHLFFLSMCYGAIPLNTRRCAARFASCCSATKKKSPSCFTSRAKFATRPRTPGRTSDERARALIEYHTKLRNILAKVDQIMEKAKRMGRPLERVNAVRSEIEQLQKEMLEQF